MKKGRGGVVETSEMTEARETLHRDRAAEQISTLVSVRVAQDSEDGEEEVDGLQTESRPQKC